MSKYATLEALINAQIKTNGTKAITGQKLNGVLGAMVSALGANYQFGGLVAPDTPFVADQEPVAFLATEAGTYTAFGGAVLDGNFLHILSWDGSSSWSDTETNIPAGDALAEYAKKDGYYASLTAGAAENLVGRGSVPAEFLFRTTGGTADVGTGAAGLAAIKGRSIVWNQLVLNGNFADGTTGWDTNGDVSFSITDGVAELVFPSAQENAGVYNSAAPLVVGHKYLEVVKIKGTGSVRVGGGGSYENVALTSSWETVNHIFTTSAQGSLTLYFRGMSAGDTEYIDSVFLVDLTLMFGAGNEPATVAEFEKLFPLPYYAYNAGVVLPFAGEKLVTTGFNQWDEEWELGSLNTETGEKTADSNMIRSKNFIPILPNTVYNFHGPFMVLCFYDGLKNYIGHGAVNSDGIVRDAQATTPDNAQFLLWRTISAYGTTYKNDICINLSWSGIRNGEYEPYEKHELAVNPATLLDKDGNLVFPYGGMHGTGTAFDSMKPEADGFIHYATRVWDRRAYEAGDESDASVITDGHAYTFVQLATPVVKELAEPIAASYYANDWGTEEWQPANGAEPYTAPCHLDIVYAMNAVDTLRNLPRNYIGAEDFDAYNTALAAALASVGITMTYARTFNQETDHHQFTITMAESQGE